MSGPRVIAIVGAGFSGTALATALLRRSTRPTRIRLIERSGTVGGGVAYADRGHPYVLNVPAAHMAMTPTEPLDFLEWAQRIDPSITADTFAERALYGRYLAARLAEAADAAAPGVVLEHVSDTVLDLDATEDGFHIHLETHGRFEAADVVLATGNPPARRPVAVPTDWPGLRTDPWTARPEADPTGPLLIVGSGLTMADVVSSSLARHPDRRFIVLSRHGLLPAGQTTFPGGATADGPLFAPGTSARRAVRVLRDLARQLIGQGEDWRIAINRARREAEGLWTGWSLRERERFLRHARSYWDVHRHRLPADVHARLHALIDRGQLEVVAGRIVAATPDGAALRVEIRPRGGSQPLARTVSEIAIATGPDYDLAQSREPLYQSLRQRGHIRPDPLGLGLAAVDGQVIGADGSARRGLWIVGPLTRGDRWEVTAVGELRAAAQQLAERLTRDAASPIG